ncbi:TonB-dependent receptor [Candidatus Nitrosacidococcus tergens]|uniref:Putative TonB-dependent siderophore receptor n=1 Tax=Candidatus Nitrosacidococcus tergens TaxID=553981 RepID=A0A7G1QC00_9GAMM|nr:TonB-dependent siderophore receptor [Candidatus Nitrosacidococcus tergens]CAB1277382.1 putative TonB-dependent siderophore receptor [Candidatus Nitrosacidococcus tergens]
MQKTSMVFAIIILLAIAPVQGAEKEKGEKTKENTTDEETKKLEPVTVMGRKLSPYRVDTNTALGTDTPVLDTPFSITPIPRQVLNDQAAQSLEDAVRNTPGVSINLGEGNRDQLIIRGVSTNSAFFMNNMRDDAEYFRPLYNVDHIDILKGPSASRFGRGNASGIVNFVTKQAERREIRHIMVEGGGGNNASPWGHFRSQLDFGTPMGDSSAFRIMGMGETSGSFRDFYFLNRYAVNPEFHFEPDDRTQIDLNLSYLNDNRLDDRGIPSQNGLPIDVSRSQFFGSPNQNRYYSQVTAGYFNIEHQFDEHLKIRNKFYVFDNTHNFSNFAPATSVNEDGMFQFLGYQSLTQRISYQDRVEIISDFNTGGIKHQVLSGADYTWQRDWASVVSPQGGFDLPQFFSINNSLLTTEVPLTSLSRNNHIAADEIGVFLQDQIAFNEHWSILLGARYDRFTVNTQFLAVNATQQQTNDTWSPQLALMYKPVEFDTMYFSFSRNYIPTGANLSSSISTPGTNISPERSDQYEFGNKLSLVDDKLLMTLAFFQINLTNIPGELPNGSPEAISIGKQRMKGIEWSTNGSITDQWNIFANYTYMPEANNLVAVVGTAAGARVGLVPRNQFSIWSTYDINKHWGFGAGVHGESNRYATFTDQVTLPTYAVGDLMAYYQTKGYRFQVNLNNVSDQTYYATAQADNQIMPGMPRSVFASVNIDF